MEERIANLRKKERKKEKREKEKSEKKWNKYYRGKELERGLQI